MTTTRTFTLTQSAQRATPAAGESLARDLCAAAYALLADVDQFPTPEQRDLKRRAAVLFHLGADAWERAASASLGHGRRARYDEAAWQFRERADSLTVEAA